MVQNVKEKSTSFRLTAEAARLLAALAERLGISQSACVEVAIREKAKRNGVS
jgi:hypothetical protein